ncbi:beta-glucanase [Streptomyces polyrhachis]|uniref:Beta-glucanase n=1 Tax=Streptomyces polyrhachis TaxID=1282885 RepID=A0ABW2GGU2_9ACTN
MRPSLAINLRALLGAAALATLLPVAVPAHAAALDHPGPGSSHPDHAALANQEAVAPNDAPIEGRELVFDEEFDGPIQWGTKWTGDRTSAYQYVNHNPNYGKLDWLTQSAVTVENGNAKFTATPSQHILENGKRAWDTGLLTTEYTTDAFQVHAYDYIETRVMLPDQQGAWPALWTWSVDNDWDAGNDEVDTFEYHPDTPNTLELTNHALFAKDYYNDPSLISPCKWVTIGTRYGLDTTDWYVDGKKVFSQPIGVADFDWKSHVILNLSIDDNEFHAPPTSDEPITFYADYVRVYR